jgi:hypothetical protein
MIATLIAETTAPGPAVREDKGESRPPRPHDPEDRLHVSALLFGLLDARTSHVDFFDTPGGRELERWYRRHHPGRRHVGH